MDETCVLPGIPAACVLQSSMNTVDIAEVHGILAGYRQISNADDTFLVMLFGQPIAELKLLAPVEDGATRAQRPYGLAEGEFVVPDDFDAPLPEDILRDFEGRGRP